MNKTRWKLVLTVLLVALFGAAGAIQADLFRARDPGVRGGPSGAGGPTFLRSL